MTQKFKEVTLNTEISTGLQRLLDRDETVLTKSFGSEPPTQPVEGQIWIDNRNSKVFKWSTEKSNWICLWDFSTGSPYNVYALDNEKQKISVTLKNLASVTPSQNDVFMFNNSLVNMKPDVAQKMLLLKNKNETREFLRIGAVADYDSIVSKSLIEDASITEDKIGYIDEDGEYQHLDLNNDIERIIKTGDVKRSFNRNYDKSKWVPLNGKTIGSNGSYADYRNATGQDVKNLYKFLWESETDLTLYAPNSTNEVEKGKTWESDWNDGKKLKLKDLTSGNPTLCGSGGEVEGFVDFDVNKCFIYERGTLAVSTAPLIGTSCLITKEILRKDPTGQYVYQDWPKWEVETVEYDDSEEISKAYINSDEAVGVPDYRNITVKKEGWLKVTLVGGGGHSDGMGMTWGNPFGRVPFTAAHSGGSGACFSGEVKLPAGNYQLKAGRQEGYSGIGTAVIAGNGGGSTGWFGNAGWGGRLTINNEVRNVDALKTGDGLRGSDFLYQAGNAPPINFKTAPKWTPSMNVQFKDSRESHDISYDTFRLKYNRTPMTKEDIGFLASYAKEPYLPGQGRFERFQNMTTNVSGVKNERDLYKLINPISAITTAVYAIAAGWEKLWGVFNNKSRKDMAFERQLSINWYAQLSTPDYDSAIGYFDTERNCYVQAFGYLIKTYPGIRFGYSQEITVHPEVGAVHDNKDSAGYLRIEDIEGITEYSGDFEVVRCLYLIKL